MGSFTSFMKILHIIPLNSSPLIRLRNTTNVTPISISKTVNCARLTRLQSKTTTQRQVNTKIGIHGVVSSIRLVFSKPYMWVVCYIVT